MKVPFTLRKSDRAASVTALLLLSEEPAELLELCARIATEAPEVMREWPALPPIHAVAGGFVVKLGQPLAAVFPGAIRLRSLSANLFLPADAELVPALLDDEAAGLVRDRGLIFLPGGRILAFAPDQCLTADMLLSLPRLPEREWSALPARPAHPERLQSLLIELPDDNANLILESGSDNIGVEAPRPAGSGPVAQAAGKIAFGAGQGLAWLGNMLHWPGLAKLGAWLAAGAMQAVPRLSEKLLGQQEAALRELLRRFRNGNLEDALRHALPLTNEPRRGAQPAGDARLPTNRLVYRLLDLLKGAGGPSSTWFGPADVHAALTREYQKAAEDATARGDYRRAAFIYGRLLNDYRSAADVLARGGLHHDAAVIFLEVLRDNLAAARAFEAAGETDRALQIYLQRGENLLAADLLRRLGEEEEAMQYYIRAADGFADSENHLAAADLLFSRAGRPDLASLYLAAGWARRPQGSAVPCLLRLTQWHAEQDKQQQLLELVAEAEEFFAPPGNDRSAGQFFNALAQVAERANLSPLRDDLRDRALCGLAAKLRPQSEIVSRSTAPVSDLFGQSGAWKAAVVSDADFAFKAALKKKRPPAKKELWIAKQCVRLSLGQLSAVCTARASGRVFLGFTNGQIGWFDPNTESLVQMPTPNRKSTIASLTTNDSGDRLIALTIDSENQRSLSSYTVSEKGYSSPVHLVVSGSGANWLTPIAENERLSVVGFWNGESLVILYSRDLLRLTEHREGYADQPARAGHVFFDGFMQGCLIFGDAIVCFFPPSQKGGTLLHLGWRPASQLRGLCSPPPLSWHWCRSRPLELAGIDEDDSIHWTEVDYSDPDNPTLGGGASTPQKNYRAAALVRSNLIAGIHAEGIHLLFRQQHRLVVGSETFIPLANAVACTVSPPTRELLVICSDGSIVRVPLLN